jgi:hypothetical protein
VHEWSFVWAHFPLPEQACPRSAGCQLLRRHDKCACRCRKVTRENECRLGLADSTATHWKLASGILVRFEFACPHSASYLDGGQGTVVAVRAVDITCETLLAARFVRVDLAAEICVGSTVGTARY